MRNAGASGYTWAQRASNLTSDGYRLLVAEAEVNPSYIRDVNYAYAFPVRKMALKHKK